VHASDKKANHEYQRILQWAFLSVVKRQNSVMNTTNEDYRESVTVHLWDTQL